MTTELQIGQNNLARTQPSSDIAVEKACATEIAHWSLGLRVAFRFCFTYFLFFTVSTQFLGGLFIVPGIRFVPLGVLWPLRQITFWTARHVFGLTRQLVYGNNGSSDKTFDWVQVFCLIVFAVVVTAVWSALDRKRRNYLVMHKWFRVFVRFALASEMFIYGFDKVIPVQMSFPFLTVLVEPYGNFSPLASLWFSVGASRAYEISVGIAEVLGGLLLIFPRTVTFGALVCLVELAQVFMLNMNYDVPVKLIPLHLMLFAIFLLAPDFRRLINFFFLESATDAPASAPLFQKLEENRLANNACRSLLAFYLMAMNVAGAIQDWRTIGDGQPKPILYGIWDVEQMTIDGQTRLPLLTDYDRWRRIIFDFTTQTSFQRMDDSFVAFRSSINERDKTITLINGRDDSRKSALTYTRPAHDQLLLDGFMDKHKIHMQLELLDRNKFNLVSRGFHWINEYPFQR
jgi:hypothetical protein